MIYNRAKRIFFDGISEIWDYKFYNERIEKKLYSIVSEMNLKSDSIVLDVGSGTGNLLRPILSNIKGKGKIIAMDYSEKMILIAKRKFSDIKNISFTVADAHSMPFKNSFFDTVICFGVFPHFDHKEIAIKEISRILKTGGRLFIAHALSSKELKEHHQRAPEVSNDFLLQENEMIEMLNRVNLKVERLEDETGKYLLEAVKN